MKLWACYGIAFLLALTILIPEGCAQDTSCLNQLVPCLKYLNGTREPPESCCKPLKSVIKSNPKCLCSLISNKVSNEAEKAGIDVNEAQQLPGRCGQYVTPVACLSTSSKKSACTCLFPSRCIILVTALSIALQILWAPCRRVI
uniref:Bifunctional inhibitor/plant lipid transfer protein/seed storage helical domain-containing protein n=1 Tax=Fagus sylvatica TaxID=28930 RepID=A0A2N9I1P6_FAGSY